MIRTSRITIAVVALVCACAPAHVAPTTQTVLTTVDRMLQGPGHLVFVENRSTVPVRVYSFTLRDCQNVNEPCSSKPVDVRVDPGGRVETARVNPSNPEKPFTYHYSFGWRADSTTTAALGALAAAGDTRAGEQLNAIRRADARQRYESGSQDRELTAADLASLAGRATSLRPVPDSLTLAVGARVPLDTIHVLVIGANNETLGRTRIVQWKVGSGAVAIAWPDSLVARTSGRASLQLQLADDVLPELTALHAAVQVPVVVRP